MIFLSYFCPALLPKAGSRGGQLKLSFVGMISVATPYFNGILVKATRQDNV